MCVFETSWYVLMMLHKIHITCWSIMESLTPHWCSGGLMAREVKRRRQLNQLKVKMAFLPFFSTEIPQLWYGSGLLAPLHLWELKTWTISKARVSEVTPEKWKRQIETIWQFDGGGRGGGHVYGLVIPHIMFDTCHPFSWLITQKWDVCVKSEKILLLFSSSSWILSWLRYHGSSMPLCLRSFL